MSAKHLISIGLAAAVTAAGGAGVATAATHHGRAAKKSASPTLKVRSSPYGKILETGKGDTVYLWVKDKPNKSACSGPCLGVWPFVKVSGKPVAGPGVNKKLLGTIKVNGGYEVTYAKHPLYLFVSDVKPGQITGQGNTSFGGPWWLVSPSGSAITKKLKK
jgi:predicted lipoprotein with Yx(FWY)xxD motif